MHGGAEPYVHRTLRGGIELVVERLPDRPIAALDIRILAGMADEPADKLGLAFLVEQTINKGTAKRSGQELSDAFDRLGALHGSSAGRESFGFRCTCLPDFLDDVVALHAEFLRTPTFPEESCEVAKELALQELTALEDDPGELSRKALSLRAYGPVLGRHLYGERETIERIGRTDIVGFWQRNFGAARLQVAAAGRVDAERLADSLEKHFSDWNPSVVRATSPAVEFSAGRWHAHKELEQQYIAICWPGVPMSDAAHPVERVMLTILGDGMSSRLFAEVRERQGLVYWVGAWHEHPRTAGMIHLGASSTPARCEQTYVTLLREVDRLADDISADELARAKTQIIARTETHGDLTRARVSELASDLFYYGRPIPMAVKNAQVQAVSVEEIRGYLSEHPRDRRCVVTLGPAAPPAA
ncbi:MAG: insulinase family protein [Phycisphaerae bacterium]|nr:insulinase family protein [Phycisphaerae bacterium]